MESLSCAFHLYRPSFCFIPCGAGKPLFSSLNDIGGSSSIVVDSSGQTTAVAGSDIEITYKITFSDAGDKKIYYLIHIDNYLSNRKYIGILNYDSEPVFKNEESFLDGVFGSSFYGRSRTFTNDIFRGKQYTLTVKERLSSPEYSFEGQLYRKISLYVLSENYYNYLTSVQHFGQESFTQDLAELGLSEPVPIYSNVNGGNGILGSCQRDYAIVDLRTLIP
ncbi:MAG: DUF4249 domain-containing protein [Tannerellaceae bacterium]|jgi:hypothetical protein|nr:DUF4249 domain-containing protein [Tannerellaceae bacterium]